MYLSNLKLWNFRKFGSDKEFNLNKPNLNLNFNKGLNVLIGENDSGKSAIIDAIKLVLKTHSYEWIRITDDDFYMNSLRCRIELRFDDFSDEEAKHFTEWLGWQGEGENAEPFLRVIYDITRNNERIFPADVRAGVDDEGYPLTAEAREYLKVTYLKPLRDAQAELIPKRNSRLSQILKGHEAFKGKEKTHYLVGLFKKFNSSIEKYFEGKDSDNKELKTDKKGEELKVEIDRLIQSFYDKSKESKFGVVEGDLKNILEKLELLIKDEVNPGLGTLNRLCISCELLHLEKKNWDGIRLGLIEELEAHLHPPAQMQIIESLQEKKNIQLILTTHSPNLGSKVKLENLIICNNGNAFPMGKEYTKLHNTDYAFLERFLDTTKANLFFAKGVILVEGWAEEILLPSLSKKMKLLGIIDKDLTEAGVSVVNVGNTAFLRYAKIFQRQKLPDLRIPVSIITDLDLKPKEFSELDSFKSDFEDHLRKQKENKALGNNKEDEDEEKNKYMKKHKIILAFDIDKVKKSIEDKYDGQSVKTFVSPQWTLEYCIALSKRLSKILFMATKQAGKEMAKDGQSGKKIKVYWRNFIKDKSQEQIAFDTYYYFIGYCKEISKSIIAQHFAKLLDRIKISKDELENKTNISYLMDAIKYASKQDKNNSR